MFFIPQDVYNLFALVYTFFWINFLTLLFPSEIPASQPGQFSLNGHIFWHWVAATLKGLGEFQNKKSRPLFTIIFKLKNGNFMTRDFSPLIETVLTGVNTSYFSKQFPNEYH